MSIAMRYCHNRDSAMEITNDAFLKIFQNIKNFDTSQPFRPWLRKIVVFTAIDEYRKNKKHKEHVTENILYINESVNPDIFSQLAEEDIMDCVQKLPHSYRTVFVLYAVEGYKHNEIADMLQISEGTSKSNLSAARGKLMHLLSEKTKKKITHNGK